MIDTGTAYGLAPPKHRPELTEVRAGTPMGELLRRYWHPIGLTADANDTPRKVRVLGEDLILFRDKRGHVGLVYPNCAHRGTSLYYGKIEEQGIRCCYHGWLFDVQGHCLDQPCEPGGGGPQVIPCNWLQHYENLMDTFHVAILHSSFSGTQFVPAMAVMPQVQWDTQEHSVRAVSNRQLPDGKTLHRISEAALPTLRVIPNPKVGRYGAVESLGWVLPIDDGSFRIYVVGRVREAGELRKMRSRFNGKLWEQLSETEHQQFPGDYEAMVSQGVMPPHSHEHFATSDLGVAMVRRLLEKQLKAIDEGRDPAGVNFDPNATPVYFSAGNFLRD